MILKKRITNMLIVTQGFKARQIMLIPKDSCKIIRNSRI